MPERDDEFVGKIEQLQRSITDWQLEADVHRKRAAAAVAEIERLREAIRRLADQDATLSVCNGNVIVTMDATLTDAEREFLQALRDAYQEMANQTGSVNAAVQADSRKNAAIIRGLLERTK
jgi:phosphoribosylformylglycinamidine (FGAM) synthase-like amidotransferase family enzyme